MNVGDKVRHPDFGEGEIVAVTAGEFGVRFDRRCVPGATTTIGYVPRDSLTLIGRTYSDPVAIPPMRMASSAPNSSTVENWRQSEPFGRIDEFAAAKNADAEPIIRPKTTDEKLTELIIAVNALRVAHERFLACLPYRPFEPGDS